MCFNCGCGDPDDDHENAKNITTATLQAAADANDQTLEETKHNIVETIATVDAEPVEEVLIITDDTEEE